MPKSGSEAVTLARGEGWATALVADDRSLYFNRRQCLAGTCAISRANSYTMRVPKSGGTPELFRQGGWGGLDIDSAHIYIGVISREYSLVRIDKVTRVLGNFHDGFLPESIALLGQSLVWTANFSPSTPTFLFRTPLPGASDGSKPASVALNDPEVGPVAVDGQHVFVRTKHSIFRADLPAKQATLVTTVRNAPVAALAAGGGTLYWNDHASLNAVSENGTNPRSLDTTGKVYGQITLDAQSIYFLRDGQVFRLQR